MSTLRDLIEQRKLALSLVELHQGELTSETENKLNELEARLLDKADAYAAVSEEFETSLSTIKARMADLKAAQDSIVNYQARFEKRFIDTMLSNEMTELVGDEYILKISPTRGSVEIIDEEKAKVLYGREKIIYTIDKTAIREALDKGEQFDFAKIQQNWSLKTRIRSKK